MTSPTLNQIERACADLARNGHPITIAKVAEHAGISRSTIYRNPELRALIEHHRQVAPDGSMTAITDELATLRQAVQTLADTVRLSVAPMMDWTDTHCRNFHRLIAPHARLNASIAAHTPQAGDLALISESSAIAAALVEWGVARSIGFSAVVSLGDALDVDFGDLLDYFAADYRTRAILLYVDQISDARKFMSAARAAARAKPVVVV